MENKKLSFTGIVEEHDGAWIAHCIDTGIVASSTIDESDALNKMVKLLDRTIRFALKHNRLSDIYHAPPKDIIHKYMEFESRFVSNTKTAYATGKGKQNLIVEQNSYALTC